MRGKQLVIIFTGLLIVGNVVFAGSKLNIEEGTWEITSTTKMQGMTMPSMTFSQCITEQNAVPQNNSQGQDKCKVTDMQTVGNTVSWTVFCQDPSGDMKGKGKITYHGDRFDGEVNMQMAGMAMVTHMRGKRIGPCQ
ncbi:MAG: DUF3617 family protein [Desulfosarcina sp.]|jgi:hypothetical protein